MFQRAFFLAALSAVLCVVPGCKPVPLTATEGAELTITANPSAIPIQGGRSTITVVGFKAQADGGGPVSDGTQIFFTTNVGVIEERVETINGIARGTLRSNGRAGIANVTARSGSGITASLSGEGGSGGVVIGNAGGEGGINIQLTANPPTVDEPDFATDLSATVFDADNNRMEGVPVIFRASAGALASQGTSLRTNENGQVFDRLTLMNEPSATVTAFSGQVASNEVTVARATVIEPIVTSVSPSSGQPGQNLNVRVNGLNFQPGAVVNFGQGISVNNVNFVNSRTLNVNITIDSNAQITTAGRTVTVTNPDGGVGSLSDAFLVTTPGALPPPFVASISPTSSATRGTAFNITITGTDFQAGATVGLNPGGITINSVTFSSSTQLIINITVDNSVVVVPPNTQFDLTVINPDGGQDTLINAFTVT